MQSEFRGFRSAQSARACPAAAALLRQILDMEERRSSAACRRQLDASSRYWVSGFIHHPSARARITARKEVGMRPVLLWFLGISVSVIILPYLFYAVYQWR
jgi:hypothetical protein